MADRDLIDVAAAHGRGVAVFRPVEAAAFLGVHRAVLDAAMSEWTGTRGRRGLAHFFCGNGKLIRRESLDRWMQQQEQLAAGA